MTRSEEELKVGTAEREDGPRPPAQVRGHRERRRRRSPSSARRSASSASRSPRATSTTRPRAPRSPRRSTRSRSMRRSQSSRSARSRRSGSASTRPPSRRSAGCPRPSQRKRSRGRRRPRPSLTEIANPAGPGVTPAPPGGLRPALVRLREARRSRAWPSDTTPVRMAAYIHVCMYDLRMRLPPGQRRVEGFPRFGTHLHHPPPAIPADPAIEIRGAVIEPLSVPLARLTTLQRREQTADFHCVAGWSATRLRWEGCRSRPSIARSSSRCFRLGKP